MKKILFIIFLNNIVFAWGINVAWNSGSCVVVKPALKAGLEAARTFFNTQRETLINHNIGEFAREIQQQTAIMGKNYESYVAISSIKEQILLEKKKNNFLQNQNLKLDELESDLLILENEIINAKNEILMTKVKSEK